MNTPENGIDAMFLFSSNNSQQVNSVALVTQNVLIVEAQHLALVNNASGDGQRLGLHPHLAATQIAIQSNVRSRGICQVIFIHQKQLCCHMFAACLQHVINSTIGGVLTTLLKICRLSKTKLMQIV